MESWRKKWSLCINPGENNVLIMNNDIFTHFSYAPDITISVIVAIEHNFRFLEGPGKTWEGAEFWVLEPPFFERNNETNEEKTDRKTLSMMMMMMPNSLCTQQKYQCARKSQSEIGFRPLCYLWNGCPQFAIVLNFAVKRNLKRTIRPIQNVESVGWFCRFTLQMTKMLNIWSYFCPF